MVSFICDECQSTLKKAKVQSHSWQCSSRSFSCIDCGVSFTPHSFSSHTQCVSEAEKYQGKLYKGKKHQTSSQQQQHPPAPLQQQQQHVHSAAHKRAAEETKEAQDDGEEENGSSVQQQQQQAKRSKQTTAEEPEEEKKEQPQEQSIAELLPATLQSESVGLRWKQLVKRIRTQKPTLDKRTVEDELWSAVQRNRKQLTFSWTLKQ